jgi:hypothetical protein
MLKVVAATVVAAISLSFVGHLTFIAACITGLALAASATVHAQTINLWTLRPAFRRCVALLR